MSSIRTWTDIDDWVTFEITAETGDTSAAAKARWMILANEFIKIHLANAPMFSKLLDSDDMTLSSGVVSLPASVVDVKNIYIAGVPIYSRTSRVALDRQIPGWQTTTTGEYAEQWFVEGHELYTYPALSALTDLTVRVMSKIPLFISTTAWSGASASYALRAYVTNDGATYRCILAHTSAAADEPGTGVNWATYWALVPSESPLDYFPEGFELLPAYYVCSRLPADDEHAAQMRRMQRNLALVDSMTPALIEEIRGLGMEDFRF